MEKRRYIIGWHVFERKTTRRTHLPSAENKFLPIRDAARDRPKQYVIRYAYARGGSKLLSPTTNYVVPRV